MPAKFAAARLRLAGAWATGVRLTDRRSTVTTLGWQSSAACQDPAHALGVPKRRAVWYGQVIRALALRLTGQIGRNIDLSDIELEFDLPSHGSSAGTPLGADSCQASQPVNSWLPHWPAGPVLSPPLTRPLLTADPPA